MERSRNEGETHGTYSILPQEPPDGRLVGGGTTNEPEVDLEAELEAMNRRARTRIPRDETTQLMNQL